MKLKRNFRKRLFNIYFLSIIVPFFILITVCTGYFKNLYTTDLDRSNNSLLSSVSYNVEYYLNGINDLSTSPYAYAEIMQFIKLLHSKQEISDVEWYNMEQSYTASINKIMSLSRNDITAVLFVPFTETPEQDAYIITRNTADRASFDSQNITKNTWYQTTLQKGGDPYFFYLSNPQYNLSAVGKSQTIFSVARLIMDVDTNRPLGIIRVDAKDNNLTTILNQLQVKPHSHLLLLDQNDNLIYTNSPLEKSTLEKMGTTDISQFESNNNFSVQKKLLSFSGWQIVSLDAYEDLNAVSGTIYLFAVCVSLVFIAITIVLYISSSNSMVKSLKEILSTMHSVEHGNLSARSHVSGSDEIATISCALNKMIRKLQEYIDREYIAVLHRKEIEYLALQSQINPHFLYNVLNGISVLNRVGDKKKVDEMIQHLTKLMRYSCQHNSSSTIGEECDFLQRYLALQKIRFEDRLDFSFSIAKDTEDIVIPKFLLQPLVENSIVHGMEPMDMPVLIEVTAERIVSAPDCEELFVMVRDNGQGFDPNTVDKKTSVGLQNVQNRLTLLHKNSVFLIDSHPGEGTTITLRIPIVRGKHKEDN